MKDSKYRLIWFQHLHKAAGSAIVDQAERNGEILFPSHRNGRAFETKKKFIDTGKMSDAELTAFINSCEERNITFVATEFTAPNYELLAADPRVFLITCLRKPVSRFISNYHFEKFQLNTKAASIEEYFKSGPDYTHENYCCKIFSRVGDGIEITEKEYDLALSNLEHFDFIAIQENKGRFKLLEQALGWTEGIQRKNTRKNNRYTKYRLLIHGKFLMFKDYLNDKIDAIDENYIKFLEEKNNLDIKLYNEIENQIKSK